MARAMARVRAMTVTRAWIEQCSLTLLTMSSENLRYLLQRQLPYLPDYRATVAAQNLPLHFRRVSYKLNVSIFLA